MDQRLSDTPEDEAARAKNKPGAQTPKQARARKSASNDTSAGTKPSARKRASGSGESSPAKPATKFGYLNTDHTQQSSGTGID